MHQHMKERGTWLKLNNRVVLDMSGEVMENRAEFMRFLMGRFMVGARPKTYLCVANHDSAVGCNGHAIAELFRAIKIAPNAWPYPVPL